MESFAALLFFRDPVSDVRRAVEQRHTVSAAASQETNSFHIDQREFLEVQHDSRFTLVDQRLHARQVLGLHSAYQSNGCFVLGGMCLDFQRHLPTICAIGFVDGNPGTRGKPRNNWSLCAAGQPNYQHSLKYRHENCVEEAYDALKR